MKKVLEPIIVLSEKAHFRTVKSYKVSKHSTEGQADWVCAKFGIRLIAQRSAVGCGAAALAMTLQYYGRNVTVSAVTKALSMKKNGASAASILRVGRAYGLQGRGVQVVQLEDFEFLPTGTILYFQRTHFVVFLGFQKKRVHIADPSRGWQSLSVKEFRQAFSGVALIFKKPSCGT